MDSNARLILTISISIAVFLGFQWLGMALGLHPTPTEPEAQQVGQLPPEGGAAPAPGAAAPGDLPAAPGSPAPQQRAAAPERTVTLRSDELDLGFSSHGAGLVRAILLGPKGQRQGGKDAPQVDLTEGLTPEDPVLFELRLGENFPETTGVRAPCTLGAHDDRSVAFVCREAGLTIEKRFTLSGARNLDLDLDVRNEGPAPVGGALSLVVPARIDPSRQSSGGGCGGFGGSPPQPTQAICRHGDGKIARLMPGDDESLLQPPGAASFAGFEERYFLAVAVPFQPSTCELTSPNPDLLISYLKANTGSLAPGASVKLRYQLVVGQKDMDFLEASSAQIASQNVVANPRLDETVDLGFWAVIARILLWLLRIFHLVIPNWGVAIILLTVTVKVVTLPLAWKSMKSMEEMRKLAPEIAELKKRYGDDREKLNLETMKLYQQHKVNPLGGCLPMLIQMPIWLALYTTLQTSVELYNEPFISGWIGDLTSKDPYYILPLVMGATMFMTQKMQPMQMDATQAKIMLYFMPIFFTAIMLQLPAGLTLYIFVNNILSIGQQMLLRRQMGLPMIGAPQPLPAGQTTIEVKGGGKGKKQR